MSKHTAPLPRPLAVAFVLTLLGSATPIPAEDRLTGQLSVIVGDTIEIHGQRIRHEGIDVPESRQTCTDAKDNPWRSGKAAAFALADKIGTATVCCEQHGKDRYKRVLASCYLSNVDLNGWLIRNGWFVAYRKYSTAYVRDEDLARAEGPNIWSGVFDMPWDWRKAHWGAAAQGRFMGFLKLHNPAVHAAPSRRPTTITPIKTESCAIWQKKTTADGSVSCP